MSRITFSKFAWRFATGNFIDGKRRTNPNQLTWWSRKPRYQRALWRWTIVLTLVSIHPAYRYSPEVHARLVVFAAGEVAPLVIWQGAVFIVNRIQPVKLVVVSDSVPRQSPETIADYGEASEIINVRNPLELDGEIAPVTGLSIPVEEFTRITRPRNGRRATPEP